MSVQVEELYKFHKEEEAFWNKHFPIQDLLPFIGFQKVEIKTPDHITATYNDEFLTLTRKEGRWSYIMGMVKDDKLIMETESGDLIDLAKKVYMPMYIQEGYHQEKNSARPVIENLRWYQDAMRVEARNNLRTLIIDQENNPELFTRKEPFISMAEREKFYTPRLHIFKEVKDHESNLVEGLTLRFGAKPYAPTLEQALIQLAEIKEEITSDLKHLANKFNLTGSAHDEMVAIAEKHAIPLMWHKDFNGRDEMEQGIYDAHKTQRDDLKY
jgi:hypothetical protein